MYVVVHFGYSLIHPEIEAPLSVPFALVGKTEVIGPDFQSLVAELPWLRSTATNKS